jgi:SAM-dependent methyltransferase
LLVPDIAANLSRGCGNPTGFANLQLGEDVVDFGCGGGVDVILASQKVGSQGIVVGIDGAEKMIDRAMEAVAEAGLENSNIELRVGDITATELPNSSVDVLISNCVINLCPDKDAVYEEAFRILRTSGRLAISDIVLTEEINPELRDRFRSSWVGCLGGAIPEDDYWEVVKQAGFGDFIVIARHTLAPDELEAMACCPGEEFFPAPAKEDIESVQGKVTSVKFTAVKASTSRDTI